MHPCHDNVTECLQGFHFFVVFVMWCLSRVVAKSYMLTLILQTESSCTWVNNKAMLCEVGVVNNFIHGDYTRVKSESDHHQGFATSLRVVMAGPSLWEKNWHKWDGLHENYKFDNEALGGSMFGISKKNCLSNKSDDVCVFFLFFILSLM